LAVPRRGASAALYAAFEFWSGFGKPICKGSAAGARGVGAFVAGCDEVDLAGASYFVGASSWRGAAPTAPNSPETTRLAWARLCGIPDDDVHRVRAAFHYVRTNETVEPAGLRDAVGLRELIAVQGHRFVYPRRCRSSLG
jgi:hypothetical protein